MKTLILEGIATSGKSTIISKLVAALAPSKSVKVVPESETLMTIADNTDKVISIAHLEGVIRKAYENPSDVVIFDRLYLTHAFRTHSNLDDFYQIENILKQFSPTTIFLKVDEAAIADRVEKATLHRDPKWKEYLATKGESKHEIAEYYINQQRYKEQLLKGSSLPYVTYDTTEHDYSTIVSSILGTCYDNLV